jgi:hypothetical protein
MFLDYDGTLSPIVTDPDAAYMSDAVRPRAALPRSPAGTYSLSWRPASRTKVHPRLTFSPLRCTGAQMRAAVRDVAKHFPTAIVSRRCRDKVHCLRHCLSQQSAPQTLGKLARAFIGHWLICLSSSFSRCTGAQLRRPLGALLRRQPWHGHQGTRLQCTLSSSPHFHLLNPLHSMTLDDQIFPSESLIRTCSPSQCCANLQASSSP